MPLEDAFEGVAERFQSKDFAWSVMAIRIQRQVGGNLAELLTTVAATMRERAFLRRQVHSAVGRGPDVRDHPLRASPRCSRSTCSSTNRDFLLPLVADPRGWVISAAGVLWLLVGCLLDVTTW